MVASQIAINRFGLGSKSGETPPPNPRKWLLDQLGRYDPSPRALAGLPRSPQLVAEFAALKGEKKEAKQAREQAIADNPGYSMAKPGQPADGRSASPANKAGAGLYRPLRDHYIDAVSARLQVAGTTETPFAERLVAFWANHFAISIDKGSVVSLAGAFENEAIRPHVMGSFREMLFAVEQHPAMMLFLDQAQSIGPGSTIAELARRRGGKRQPGLNENLAREIMELHTLGVRSGYTQADVTELARALTGHTVSGLGRIARLVGGEPGRWIFAPMLHEPGPRSIMGKRYAQEAAQQAPAILADLAAHPATARHIATKLARHFCNDDPPPALIARLEARFLETSGDLPSLYRVLIDSPEPWDPGLPGKFRSPWDWIVALRRATGAEFPGQSTVFSLRELGQPVWKPGSPAGWDDVSASWAAPDALLRRVELAGRIAGRFPALDARQLSRQLFPDKLSEHTSQAIAKAESPAQALALLFVSPEMLRR